MTDLLKQAVIALMESEFSALDFTTNVDADCFIEIQPAWEGFGCVEIQEDQGQLIVHWGRFTHSHIDSYDDKVEERVSDIVDNLRQLLGKVISDRVAFWGQYHGGSGGFFSIYDGISVGDQRPAYLWSGKELI